MKTIHSLPLLLLALFTTVNLAATVPNNAGLNSETPSDTSSNAIFNAVANLTASAGNRGTTCNQRSIKSPLNFGECAGAIRGLPSTADVGIFSNVGADDFAIPAFANYKGCQVLVEPRGFTTKTKSSWLEIGLAAVELNEQCFGVSSLGSAITYTGVVNGIKITLQPAR